MPRVMKPRGGIRRTTTPLLMARWPSLEVALEVLYHMEQDWLKAVAADS